MDTPTIDINDATSAVMNTVLGFHCSLPQRKRKALINEINARLLDKATVPTRTPKGQFVGDDPATKKDESRTSAKKATKKAAKGKKK